MQTLNADDWFRFSAECDRLGLAHVRAGSLAECGLPPYETATHAIVASQAGGEYWEQMKRMRAADPALAAHEHPLDTFTRRNAERLRGLLGAACTGVGFPFDDDPVDFLGVAQRLGMGKPSRLVILIHPEYGLWFAFRMIFFVRDVEGVLPLAEPLTSTPCDACDGPCVTACPAGAVKGDPGSERLDYPASFRFRLAHEGVCADACAARLACPAGAAYRYPLDFVAHSHHRAFAVGKAWVEAQEQNLGQG